jgi:hypothetical protein
MRVKITLICVIASAALTGCGGGSDSGATAKEASGSPSGTTAKGATGSAGSGKAGKENAPIPTSNVLHDLLEGLDKSGAPLSKAKFIETGDEICRRSGTRIETEVQRHKTEYGMGFGKHPNNKQELEVITDLVLPVIQAEAEALAQLEVPAGDEAEIAAIVKALEKGVAETEAKPSRARNKGAKNPLDEASKLSQQYGFKICGR